MDMPDAVPVFQFLPVTMGINDQHEENDQAADQEQNDHRFLLPYFPDKTVGFGRHSNLT